jgi:hypothetical protein
MRIGCRHLLPAIGLLLFAVITYNNFKINHRVHPRSYKYFYWSGGRLDTDPLNKHPDLERPCEEGADCIGWDLLEMRSNPGWETRSLVLSGLPAFAAGGIIVFVLGKLGVSQLVSFMLFMPPLLFGWYYYLGSVIDRRVARMKTKT